MNSQICIACGNPLRSREAARASVCPSCGAVQFATQALSSGTQPNVLLAVGIATALSAIFYLLGPLLLLRNTPIFHLFCQHGWVPYALVELFFTALCVIMLKLPLIVKEASAFSLSLLPEDEDGLIDAVGGKQILGRIGRLMPRQRSFMLVMRIRQALLRLNQLGTAEKLDDLLRYRGEADANAIESSYAIPKFIIWAIPVLGFVGTVLGISTGVQSFSTLIQNASDLESLRGSLRGVTDGLGQAFETTMIALCMSLFLMLVMSILQRREDRLLAALDDYCMEHLLHKVRVSAAAPVAPPPNPDVVALTAALRDLTERCRELQSVQETALRQAASPSSGARGNGR